MMLNKTLKVRPCEDHEAAENVTVFGGGTNGLREATGGRLIVGLLVMCGKTEKDDGIRSRSQWRANMPKDKRTKVRAKAAINCKVDVYHKSGRKPDPETLSDYKDVWTRIRSPCIFLS